MQRTVTAFSPDCSVCSHVHPIGLNVQHSLCRSASCHAHEYAQNAPENVVGDSDCDIVRSCMGRKKWEKMRGLIRTMMRHGDVRHRLLTPVRRLGYGAFGSVWLTDPGRRATKVQCWDVSHDKQKRAEFDMFGLHSTRPSFLLDVPVSDRLEAHDFKRVICTDANMACLGEISVATSMGRLGVGPLIRSAWIHGARLFVEMDRVRGATLGRMVEGGKRYSAAIERAILATARRMLAADGHVHADLHGDNIIISRTRSRAIGRPTYRAQFIDWGIVGRKVEDKAAWLATLKYSLRAKYRHGVRGRDAVRLKADELCAADRATAKNRRARKEAASAAARAAAERAAAALRDANSWRDRRVRQRSIRIAQDDSQAN